MSAKPTALLVYDGQCPFCSNYVWLLRLRNTLNITLVSARDDHPIVRLLEERGIDLDQEMTLVLGDDIYSGGDCINRLALMSTPVGFFNRVNAALFSSPTNARMAYPLLRCGRNLALKFLNRSRIARRTSQSART